MRGMAREYAAGNSRGPTDVPPAKAAQEGPEGRWRLDCATENTGRPTGRSASASSMQSPPASAVATSVSILSPLLARPGAPSRSS